MGFDILDKFYFEGESFIDREDWFEAELTKLSEKLRAEKTSVEENEEQP
jgi:hypothetical protein